MKRAFLDGYGQGFILLFSLLVIIGGLALNVIATIVVLAFHNIAISDFQQFYESGINESNIGIFKSLQIINGISVFVIPSIVAAWLISAKPLNYLGLQKKVNVSLIIVASLAIVLAIPLINSLSYFNQMLKFPDFMSGIEKWMIEKENQTMEISVSFLNVHSLKGLFVNILMIGVVAAIGEEMVFRGIIQKPLVQLFNSIHVGVFLSAFLFAAVHFQFFTFLPRFVLGLYLGYLFAWSGNLWYPILAHFVNNTFIVIATYVMNISGKNINLDAVGLEKEMIPYAIISTFFMVVLIYIFKRKNLMSQNR